MASLKDTVKALSKTVAYWTFEETSGTTIVDHDTGAYPLTSFGPTLGQPSVILSDPSGKSAFFDGVNDYMRRNLGLLGGDLRLQPIEMMYCFTMPDVWTPGKYLWNFCPTGQANDGRGMAFSIHESWVQFQKGIGPPTFFIYLAAPADIISPLKSYMTFASVNAAGHMKLYVREITYRENCTMAVVASNEDTLPIIWGDKFGVYYPDPGQLYFGGTRTDAPLGGPDALGTDTGWSKIYVAHAAVFNDLLTDAERESVFCSATLPSPVVGDLPEWYTPWKHRQKEGERTAFKTYADFEAMVAANPTTVLLEGTHKVMPTNHLNNLPNGLYIIRGPAWKRYTWDAALVVAHGTATSYAVNAPTVAQRGAFYSQLVSMGIA